MSRLSFRPRPLDFNKKIPIVKSVKDFEDDEVPTSARNSQTLRLTAEADNEVQQSSAKKVASEIPTPQFVVVDTYERDYSPTFTQPTSYLRARGARAEIGEFVEYDLDNEDEDWLQEFNKERKTLAAEKFETIIFKLEVLDHKARERAGVITPALGSPVPVLLTFDAAVEALQALSIKYGVFQSIYNYWKEKISRLLVLQFLKNLQHHGVAQMVAKTCPSTFAAANNLYLALTPQPPPPVSDTNPYNVFRPREKAHKLHTRRMQRRENNVQSFEKLRQVRRNLDQAKTIVEALIKREEKKRELLESEITLQRIQMNYKSSFICTGFSNWSTNFEYIAWQLFLGNLHAYGLRMTVEQLGALCLRIKHRSYCPVEEKILHYSFGIDNFLPILLGHGTISCCKEQKWFQWKLIKTPCLEALGFQKQCHSIHETQLLEESLALSGLPSFPSKLGSSEEDFDSDDVASSRPHRQPPVVQNPPFTESKRVMVPAGNVKRETRRHVPYTWLHKLDPTEPVLLFTKPLLADKLAASGIIPPLDPSTPKGTSPRSFIRGRIGRGGRIVFDRWNPLMHTPIDRGETRYVPPKSRHSAYH
ncbi:Enhancer of polycomb1 [Sesamum angolense]|uniref:Enhancer of polycomb-like protein n=1 Tax=Sesamum angolense TaxID=2727404 RepID=A0AAE1WZ42_9LAMI|nr:Enhancer of polycomb1 [Sesamum angolense]